MRLVLLSTMLFLGLVGSGCSSQVKIEDKPLYWPVTDGTATRSWTVSETVDRLTAAEWSSVMALGVVAMSFDTYAWFRATIEKLCSEHKGFCGADTKKQMAGFFSRVERAKARSRDKFLGGIK